MAVVDEARGEARYVVRETREEWPCCSQFGYGSGGRVCEAASWQRGNCHPIFLLSDFDRLLRSQLFKIEFLDVLFNGFCVNLEKG